MKENCCLIVEEYFKKRLFVFLTVKKKQIKNEKKQIKKKKNEKKFIDSFLFPHFDFIRHRNISNQKNRRSKIESVWEFQ